ncbi:hypothetical protein BY458DRAFT_516958 [Sporodiniella umbellata]|nr:hypothetical protein BY458DRAFT_516958 [Sporodiniella umbellata]
MAQRHSALDLKPNDCFQKLCETMISEGLERQRIEDFRVILHMIMLECSRANIETGKTWVFEHCHSATQTFALMEYLLSLSNSRSGKEERLHLIYLVNDLLYHAARKQMIWMRDAIFPLLVPLLKLAYEIAETDEYKAKVTKCITFWSDRDIFDHETILKLKQSVAGSTLLPPLSIPQVPYTSPQSFTPPIKIQMVTPPKPYYELPAGIMTLMKHNKYYQPINPKNIKVPFPRPPPSRETLAAVENFYTGLKSVEQEDPVFDDSTPIDPQGWEKGYLDKFYERSIANRNRSQSPKRQRKKSRGSPARNRHKSQSRERYRSPSKDRYRSQSRGRYRSRSSSRDRYRSRSSSRDLYKSRSPSRDRYKSPRRGRSPRRHMRSPSPPYQNRPSRTHDTKNAGLGSRNTDEFAAFRQNKSQSYNRRDISSQFVCYKCGKSGHLARECNSL